MLNQKRRSLSNIFFQLTLAKMKEYLDSVFEIH